MTTTIHNNGWHDCGHDINDLEALFRLLETQTLDPSYLACGGFIKPCNGFTTITGNFLNLSHLFRINTTDKALIERFTRAINKNMQNAAFQSKAHAIMDDARSKQHRFPIHYSKIVIGMRSAGLLGV